MEKLLLPLYTALFGWLLHCTTNQRTCQWATLLLLRAGKLNLASTANLLTQPVTDGTVQQSRLLTSIFSKHIAARLSVFSKMTLSVSFSSEIGEFVSMSKFPRCYKKFTIRQIPLLCYQYDTIR